MQTVIDFLYFLFPFIFKIFFFFASLFVDEAPSQDKHKESLFGAVQKGNKEMLEQFMQRGDEVNVKNKQGNTSLHVAALYGCIGVAKLLMTKDANVHFKANDGRTPLHLTAWRRHKRTEQGFVKRDWRETIKGRCNFQSEIAQLLIKKGGTW